MVFTAEGKLKVLSLVMVVVARLDLGVGEGSINQ
jgi:hypothetical protein